MSQLRRSSLTPKSRTNNKLRLTSLRRVLSVLAFAYVTRSRKRRALGSPCMPPVRVLYTEPNGSVFTNPPRCLVRRALGRHPTRRSGAARAFRRVDYGPCRELPHDPHGHEEARRRV